MSVQSQTRVTRAARASVQIISLAAMDRAGWCSAFARLRFRCLAAQRLRSSLAFADRCVRLKELRDKARIALGELAGTPCQNEESVGSAPQSLHEDILGAKDQVVYGSAKPTAAQMDHATKPWPRQPVDACSKEDNWLEAEKFLSGNDVSGNKSRPCEPHSKRAIWIKQLKVQ